MALNQVATRLLLNSLRPRQNGRHFADDIFKCSFLNENAWIPTKISMKFAPKGPINNIPALVQIVVWRRPGDKPLSEPMMVSSTTHICVTRPQWVNRYTINIVVKNLGYSLQFRNKEITNTITLYTRNARLSTFIARNYTYNTKYADKTIYAKIAYWK